MRKVLLAASAVVLTFGIVAGEASAEERIWANVAVNAVPGWFNPGVDASVDITAGRGADIGHIAWHADNWKNINRDGLGSISAVAAGAVNDGTIVVGQESLETKDVTADVQVRGRYYSDRQYAHIAGHLGMGGPDGLDLALDGGHYFREDGGYFRANGDFSGSYESFEGVPAGIAVNAALNTENINSSVTISAARGGWWDAGGSIGNIGSVSAAAIGAQNTGTIVVGVPGNLGALGLSGIE